MPYEQRLGSGSLFKNRKYSEDSKKPNLTGTALVQVGNQLVELELAGWTRESEKAGKWISLSVKVKGMRDAEEDVHGAFGNR